jgi:hypothetical protein
VLSAVTGRTGTGIGVRRHGLTGQREPVTLVPLRDEEFLTLALVGGRSLLVPMVACLLLDGPADLPQVPQEGV